MKAMRIRLIRGLFWSGFIGLFLWISAPEFFASPARSPQMGSKMPPQMGSQMPSQMPMPEEIGGHVLNGTSGKPQPAVNLNIVKPGQGGMEIVRTIRSDGQGKFILTKASELLQSPHLLQA
jgi:hypothetical protein